MNVLNQAVGEKFAIYNGDSCEVLKGIPTDSIHYSITSIPFASLYTYSNSDRDFGNSRSYDEFAKQYEFLGREWYRITMSGRLVSIHCMNLPAMKERDGFIGVKDFRGDIIRWMQKSGFIFHSEVCIWKNPVVEMQRTKALGLLHKQIKKNSCMSRMGIPDYIVTFRKPGENPEPTEHTNESYPVDHWQQVASPVWEEFPSPIWWDINQSATLQRNSARTEKDEKHICPLQLPVIERCIELWTNPGDVVLDPFDGIGSTGYQAIKMGRRHIGIELKYSYYQQAVANCETAESEVISNDDINHSETPKCITGKNPYGLCSCCHTDGIKCCAVCPTADDCNICCGWLSANKKSEEH